MILDAQVKGEAYKGLLSKNAEELTNEFNPKLISLHGSTFGQSWLQAIGKQTTNLASINIPTLKIFTVSEMPLGERRLIIAEGVYEGKPTKTRNRKLKKVTSL